MLKKTERWFQSDDQRENYKETIWAIDTTQWLIVALVVTLSLLFISA